MLEQIDQIIKVIDGAVWGLPLIILILFTGFLLTTRLGLLQIRHLMYYFLIPFIVFTSKISYYAFVFSI